MNELQIEKQRDLAALILFSSLMIARFVSRRLVAQAPANAPSPAEIKVAKGFDLRNVRTDCSSHSVIVIEGIIVFNTRKGPQNIIKQNSSLEPAY